ncbi:MAG: hypothetical protein J3R72DRAFT_187571 [Linnemannia gamsii]|nr:MAG: hypothetical protein J3R72DRAFT_187571 [Linnemannia gamsii]
MTIYDTSSTVQAVCRVYENGLAVTDNGAGTIHIVCHLDPSSGKNILLWDDIKAVFGNALYVRSGDLAIPFLKGLDFKNLDPLRIAAIPGLTLNVVVTGPAMVASPPLSALQAPPSRDLTHKNVKEWAKAIAENVSFFGSNYAPTICSEVPSTTACAFTPLIVPTESEAGSLWNERVQEARWEGRLLIETADAQETQHQQQIRNNSSVSPQEVPTAPISFTPELANMMARAESGDYAAQETLGDMCIDGEVVPRDVQAAIDWYLRTDSGGGSTAIETKLRSICLSNIGVTQEYLTAVDRHHKAVVQGGFAAQRNLGGLYFAAQDYTQALTWYQKAAEQGDTTAQHNIGYLYHKGLGVSQDYAEAMTWYRKAAEQGLAAAQDNIGKLYHKGLGVSQDYAEAMTWYRKAAEQGLAVAQYNIGYLYRKGLGVSQDYVEAMTWYRKAAEQGLAAAQDNIGKLYHKGLGVSQDYAEAMTWYRKAAGQGLAAAQYNIGYLYRKGLGVSQDYAEAMTWYRKAAEQGHAAAQDNIGYLYRKGLGVSQDYAEAMTWSRKAVEQGNAAV